jgi:hypothetical protein
MAVGQVREQLRVGEVGRLIYTEGGADVDANAHIEAVARRGLPPF